VAFARFEFEELDEELSRPPLAALRAMRGVGIAVSDAAWRTVPTDLRLALASLGSHEVLDMVAIRFATGRLPPRAVQLVKIRTEPDGTKVPPKLDAALANVHPVGPKEWAAIHPFERWVLDLLASNTRLLWRAIAELTCREGHVLSATLVRPFLGELAICDVCCDPQALVDVISREPRFERARSAGRRAARNVPNVFDACADLLIGPVELDCAPTTVPGRQQWQAHASTVNGEFVPIAALAAASAAALVVLEAARTLDHEARLANLGITVTSWCGGADFDETTQMMTGNR
jgi:hypothetical protein